MCVLSQSLNCFNRIVVGCPEGCLEMHFLDNTAPHVLRQPSVSCEYPSIMTIAWVFHADKHWRVFSGDSFGNITCWTATVIASMCDAYAFYQSLRKSKASGMIGDLSDAILDGTLSGSYKFTSILEIEEHTHVPLQVCKITCLMMDDRRDFLITGDAVGVLRMFTNTMEEMWKSEKHNCAIRSIAITRAKGMFASGDVRLYMSSHLKLFSRVSSGSRKVLGLGLVEEDNFIRR